MEKKAVGYADPGMDHPHWLPLLGPGRALIGRIRFLSEKVAFRAARTQQYSDGQDDSCPGSRSNAPCEMYCGFQVNVRKMVDNTQTSDFTNQQSLR